MILHNIIVNHNSQGIRYLGSCRTFRIRRREPKLDELLLGTCSCFSRGLLASHVGASLEVGVIVRPD